jgi:hypothetical protein
MEMRNQSDGRLSGVITFALLLIGATLFLLTSASDARACSVQGRFRLSSEGPWPRTMILRSGDGCGNTFFLHGPGFYQRLYLVARPQHGNVVLREGGHYRYFSTAGYHGSDSFMLRVCGNVSGANGCANLQYSVTVE